MNLIREMVAKGSGLTEAEVSGHKEWPDAAFLNYGEAAFFCLLLAGRTMEIEVRVNGTDERMKECTIKDLIAEKGLSSVSLVVEYNGRSV